MPRRGRHRTTGPVRIVAAAAAVLVAGGVVVAAGSASARTGSDSADGSSLVSRLSESLSRSGDDDRASNGSDGSDGSDEQSSEDQRTDRDSGDHDARDGGDRDSHDADRGDRDSDNGGHQDGSSGIGRRDDGSRGDQDRGRDHNGDQNEDRKDDGNDDGNDDGDEGQAEEQFKGRDQAAPPDASDFVDIQQVDPGSEGQGGRFSAAGTFRVDCGTNADGSHRNSDNIVLGPGKRNAAQHVHDYVGTTATTFASSDDELRSASTTCTNGDQSTYYWPVIRDLNSTGPDTSDDGGGLDGNFGSVLPAASVDLTFHGNSTDDVVAAPQGLRLATGDAKAGTNGEENANAKWTCTGFEDRTTTLYPLCPQGSSLVRILDFPSCWDGENTDSDDHRSHVAFPEEDGTCDGGTVPIPALRMTLTYDRPDGRAFALDSFPDQQHDPVTDHASSINLMPSRLMDRAVSCINDGQAC